MNDSSMGMRFSFAGRNKTWDVCSGQPQLMGVLNVTPDSFSDGGLFTSVETAVARAIEMQRQGASVIDIGGESTRPGADVISEREEIRRVVPVIEALRLRTNIIISIDTSKASVAKAAINAGANVINDVSGFRFDDDMASVAATSDAGCILMHTPARPDEMDNHAVYDDVVETVKAALVQSIERATRAGVCRHHIMLDPGFGFGKTP
ncbi:MAG: dihydropteroate synthase, partial [Bradymonadia bacterium]